MNYENACKLARLADKLEADTEYYDQGDIGHCAFPRAREFFEHTPKNTPFAIGAIVDEFGLSEDEADYVFGSTFSIAHMAKSVGIRFKRCASAKDAAERIDRLIKKYHNLEKD